MQRNFTFQTEFKCKIFTMVISFIFNWNEDSYLQQILLPTQSHFEIEPEVNLKMAYSISQVFYVSHSYWSPLGIICMIPGSPHASSNETEANMSLTSAQTLIEEERLPDKPKQHSNKKV